MLLLSVQKYNNVLLMSIMIILYYIGQEHKGGLKLVKKQMKKI